MSHPLWLRVLLAFMLAVMPMAWLAGDLMRAQDTMILQSQQAARRVAEISAARERLSTALRGLERALRQQQVLKTDAMVQLVRRHRNRVAEQTRELAGLAHPEAPPDALIQALQALPDDAPEAALDQLAGLRSKALQALENRAQAATRQALDDLIRDSHAHQARSARLMTLFAGLTLALVMLFTLGLSLPLKRLARATRLLGQPDWQPPGHSSIREIRELTRTLDQASHRLLEAEARKLVYLHQVSHALKTPLATLQEGIALLHDRIAGPLTPTQTEVLSLMQSGTRDMQRQIENLLLLNRLDQTSTPEDTRARDLRQLIEQLYTAYLPRLIRRQLVLCIGGPPLALHAPAVPLQGILENLFANMTQYAPPDTRCHVIWQVTPEGCTLRFVNAGPPLTDTQAARLFRPFERGDTGTRHSGSGIGLYVARALAESLGGTLDFEPEMDEGLCFVVRLPARLCQHGD